MREQKIMQYIESISLIAEHTQDHVAIQNTGLLYYFANKIALDHFCLSDSRSLKEKNLIQLLVVSNRVNQQINKIKSKCLTKKLAISAVGLFNFANKPINLYSLNFYPIIDDEGEILGVRECIKLYPRVRPLLYNSFSMRQKLENLAEYNVVNVQLTKKEYLIVFLLTYGFNIKQISYFIYRHGGSTSTSTIRNIIHKQLFKKLRSASLQELIKKATILDIVNHGFPDVFDNFQFVIEE